MSSLRRFWSSTVGKKVAMAVSGLVMIAFLIFHLSANLLVYAGPHMINRLANTLDAQQVALWPARLVLLAAVLLHVVAALQLIARDRAARPVRYTKLEPQVATWAGRTMRWSGLALALFILFHILHLSAGVLQPVAFDPLDIYHDVVGGLRVPWVAAVYLVGLAALGLHLYHGWWASFRSLGIAPPSSKPRRRPFGLLIALVLWIGFSSIPLAALSGILQP